MSVSAGYVGCWVFPICVSGVITVVAVVVAGVGGVGDVDVGVDFGHGGVGGITAACLMERSPGREGNKRTGEVEFARFYPPLTCGEAGPSRIDDPSPPRHSCDTRVRLGLIANFLQGSIGFISQKITYIYTRSNFYLVHYSCTQPVQQGHKQVYRVGSRSTCSPLTIRLIKLVNTVSNMVTYGLQSRSIAVDHQ